MSREWARAQERPAAVRRVRLTHELSDALEAVIDGGHPDLVLRAEPGMQQIVAHAELSGVVEDGSIGRIAVGTVGFVTPLGLVSRF